MLLGDQLILINILKTLIFKVLYFLKNVSAHILVKGKKKCLHFSTVLAAVIKCKQYSGITVESGTPIESVKITLNIIAVQPKNSNLERTLGTISGYTPPRMAKISGLNS